MKQPLLGWILTAFALGACEHGVDTPPATVEPPVAAAAAHYTCPMHPHYIATDAAGRCPICGMDLVPVEADNTETARGEILYYRHPMGQPDTSPVPRKDSMGMDDIPVYANEGADPGVVVAPEMIQTMGIRTVPAAMKTLRATLRAFGVVEPNERLEHVAVARLEGWIVNLAIRAVGDTVRTGALLYEVYSPALIAAQEDFLAALSAGGEVRTAAVRQRLRALGMPARTIGRLVETREVMTHVPVHAEADGIVAALQAREGDYLKPGTPVMRVQSYASVWVIASVPESEVPLIRVGRQVQYSFPSAPGASGAGVIDHVYPTIDSGTRTASVRIEVDNADGSLRPGAYAEVLMTLDSGERLSIPTEAILRDSRGAHVIVASGQGRFASRPIRTGISADGRTEVTAGLKVGETVVTSGQFLLDSEANLREGLAKLGAPTAATAEPVARLSDLSVDTATLAQIDHLTDLALYFHEALTTRQRFNPDLVDPALALSWVLGAQFAATPLEPILADAARAVRAAKTAGGGTSLASALARLMDALQPWLLEGAPTHYRDAGLAFFRDTASGRTWIQQGKTPRNPYGNAAAERIAWPDGATDRGKAQR